MICERCTMEYRPPVNRPDWPKCITCTMSPARSGMKRLGVTPAYPLPPATRDIVTFIVPGRPLSFNRVFAGGNFRHTQEARLYKSNVRAHALSALGTLAYQWDKSRRFTISLTAYFATDRSDSDNVIKPVKDALQDMPGLKGSGVLYFNDSQVISDHTEKYVDPIAPRLVVTVRAVQ